MMRLLLSPLTAAFLAMGSGPLLAAVQPGPLYTVTTLTDRNNATAQIGDCSLREAIKAATAKGVPASIIFGASLKGAATLSSSLGELKLTTPVSILGPGARVISIVGGGARVLRVSGGPHYISGLTLRGGDVESSLEQGDNIGGGGILNTGDLTLTECTLSNNDATSVRSYEAKGGAIYNGGRISLIRCTLNGNNANGGASIVGRGLNGLGGAVYNESGKALIADHCTFFGNGGKGGTGTTGSPYLGQACGAIYNEGSVTLWSCTLSGNTATGGPRGTTASNAVGGIYNNGGSVSLQNTIIAGNTSTGFPSYRDVRGTFGSAGNNLIGATNGAFGESDVSGFSVTGDQTGSDASPKDAKLGAFQANGGPTDNMQPLVNSPVIDKGVQQPLEFIDQRGYIRCNDLPTVTNATNGNGTDIGAVEYYAAGVSAMPPTVSFLGDKARVILQGDPGRKYKFQKSIELVIFLDFTPSLSAYADGTGKLEFIDPDELPGTRFYRGVVEP